MNRISCIFMLLLITATSFCQQIDSLPTLDKQDYLQKSKKQKTAAWLLLSGGFVLSTVGAVVALDDAVAATDEALITIVSLGTVDPEINDKDNTALANVLFFTGLGSMIGSIPLFSAAKKNKRRGMSFSLSNQKIPSLQKSNFVYHQIPSVKLKIGL